MKVTGSGKVRTIETGQGGYRNKITITETTKGLVIKQFGRNIIISVDGFKKQAPKQKSTDKVCPSLSCQYK